VATHPSSDQVPTPADIESRQDAILRQLEALERRIAQVLSEHGVAIELPAPGMIGLPAAATGPRLADTQSAEIDEPSSADSAAGPYSGRQDAAA
jgi:hypothetical protein